MSPGRTGRDNFTENSDPAGSQLWDDKLNAADCREYLDLVHLARPAATPGAFPGPLALQTIFPSNAMLLQTDANLVGRWTSVSLLTALSNKSILQIRMIS